MNFIRGMKSFGEDTFSKDDNFCYNVLTRNLLNSNIYAS